MLRLIATIAVGVLVGLGVPAHAHAWQLNKGTNGVVISRESDDTSKAAEVFVYYGYKGGEVDWTDTFSPTVTSSYNLNKRYRFALAADYGTSFEVPLHKDHRLQLVYVRETVSPNTPLATFAVINEPVQVREVEPIESVKVSDLPGVKVAEIVPVSLIGTSTPWPVEVTNRVSTDTTVTSMPAMSVDTTLPVVLEGDQGRAVVGTSVGVMLMTLAAGFGLGKKVV